MSSSRSFLLPGALLCVALTGAGTALAVPTGVRSDSAAPLPPSAWSLPAARHLLRRAGFGGTTEEARELYELGLDGAVDRLLDWQGRPDPRVPHAPIEHTSRPGPDEMRGQTREERQRIARDYRGRDRRQYAAIREWWAQAMIRTAFPARERLTLFWHGHFTSSYRDVRNSYHMFIQNTLLRRHAAGNFRALLHAIAKDPAMLEYLDNNRNRKGKPNENFAREVMELFTLGAGNYTEKDIKEAARAFTGWTFVGNRFTFDRNQHDTGEKVFLGRRGDFEGDAVLDIILEQPAASRFLARKLLTYYAHADPAPEVVEALAKSLRDNDWELRPVLRQLFRSQAFYAAPSVGKRVKSPVELIVSLYRSLGMDSSYSVGISFLAGNLGQGLMDPPNVKGWAGGRDWITTSNLLNRYNVASGLVGLPEDKIRDLANQRIPGMRMMMQEAMERSSADSMEEGARKTAGEQEQGRGGGRRGRGDRRGRAEYARRITFDVVAEVEGRGLIRDPRAVVDHFCRTLLAVPLDAGTRDQLIEYLERDGGYPATPGAELRTRLHGLLRLIVSTPEFQVS